MSVFQVFVFAMTLHPHVVRAAQAELDTVVGPSRLPAFADRPQLVYINAIVKECLRWLPVMPLTPRMTTGDDVYEGFFIPAKCLILPNAW